MNLIIRGIFSLISYFKSFIYYSKHYEQSKRCFHDFSFYCNQNEKGILKKLSRWELYICQQFYKQFPLSNKGGRT